MNNIILPQLGEGVTKATVVCWHKTIGEPIVAGDDICEVVTDKATFNIEAPRSGNLRQINAAVGQDIAVGSSLGIIE